MALPPGLPTSLDRARDQAEALPLEEDPDGDEPIGDGLYARGSVVAGGPPRPLRRAEVLLEEPRQTLKGLVVRKNDSKPASIPEEELAALFATGFPLPIEAFPKEKLRDTFISSRGRHRKHHAIDLGAPKGTPIVAVNDGTIERLGRDRRGGIVIYLRDATGRFVYYYAHLSRYAPGLRVGDRVKRGQKIGEVGLDGALLRPAPPLLHLPRHRLPEPVEGARRQPLPRLLRARRPEVTRGPGPLPPPPAPFWRTSALTARAPRRQNPHMNHRVVLYRPAEPLPDALAQAVREAGLDDRPSAGGPPAPGGRPRALPRDGTLAGRPPRPPPGERPGRPRQVGRRAGRARCRASPFRPTPRRLSSRRSSRPPPRSPPRGRRPRPSPAGSPRPRSASPP